MVSPLKGLTRAAIHARALARKAALASKRAQKKPRKKRATTSKTRVRVSQATVNRVLRLGRETARAQAAKPGVSAEFKEAVNRVYPTRPKRRKK